jgi:hypothetical protein
VRGIIPPRPLCSSMAWCFGKREVFRVTFTAQSVKIGFGVGAGGGVGGDSAHPCRSRASVNGFRAARKLCVRETLLITMCLLSSCSCLQCETLLRAPVLRNF